MDANKITLASYIVYLQGMYKRYGNISIAATVAITILTVLNFGVSDQNIALTIRKIVPKIVNNTTILLIFISHKG